MAIVMIDQPGLSVPTIECDFCGGVILESGNAQWRVNWYRAPIYFTHKKCCAQFERRAGGRGEWYCTELSAFLYNLAHNTKVDWDKAGQLSDLLRTIG